MRSRDETRREVLRRMPRGGKAAEIGVWRGIFSQTILDEADPSELHLIDPWLYQPEFPNTMFGREKNADTMGEMFEEVSARFADNPKVKIHRSTSEEALGGFPDGYFDWVYVDGNHNEPFVSRDLELSCRKVRPGGFIAGDDLHWKGSGDFPVRAAVHRFVKDLGPGAKMTRLGQQYIIHLPEASPAEG